MKKTLLVLSMLGAGTALMAQETTKAGPNDGRMSAQEMLNMKPAETAPIRQTYVPDEVMDRVMGTYGEQLYSVKQVKSGSGEHVYQVTLVNNNQTSVAWVGETGSEVAYVYRTDEKEIMAGTNTNNASNAASTEPVEAAPTVDDNTTDNNALDNSANTLNEPTEKTETETLVPEENTSNPNENTNTETPKPEATLPPSNNVNTNTNTSKPDGDQ